MKIRFITIVILIISQSVFAKDKVKPVTPSTKQQADGVSATDFGIKGDSTLIAQADLDKFFNAAIQQNKYADFPKGTYVFPENFTYSSAMNTLRIRGENKNNTIITTHWGSNDTRIVERIDLTKKKKVGDGIYRVDIIGKTDPSWSGVSNAQINDYVKVSNGKPAMSSLEDAKAAGYVTELDITLPDPGIDGRYVVAALDYVTSGGGYAHTPLPYNPAVPVLIGSYLQRTNNVWSRVDPSNGFVPGGNFSMENIQFRDCSFYIVTPKNKTSPDQDYLQLTNCIFKQCIRINGQDRQFVTSARNFTDKGGFRQGLQYHFSDGKSFNYKDISITGCEFSYIHTSLFWEFPPTRNLTVKDNFVHDCYTLNEMFLYLPMSSYAKVNNDEAEERMGFTNRTTTLYENNVVQDVRAYSPVSISGTHIFRVNGHAKIINNKILNSSGTCFYLSGNDIHVENNTIVPFIDGFSGRSTEKAWNGGVIFHVKGGDIVSDEGVTIANNKVLKSANCQPIDIKANSNMPITVTGNTIMSYGYVESLLPTDTGMNKQLMYRVYDVQRFTQLAGTYDKDIAVNDLTYWDIRRNKWMKYPTRMNRRTTVVEKNYNYDFTKKVNFTDNVLYGYAFVKIIDGNVNSIEADGNTMYLNSGLLMNTEGKALDTLVLKHNTIYWGVNAPIVRNRNINYLEASDNTIYYTQVASPTVYFSDRCDWTDNQVLPWPKYASAAVNSTLQAPKPTAETAVKFISTANGQLNLNRGSIDSYLARTACLTINGVQTVHVDGTHFKARLLKDSGPASDKRFVFYNVDPDQAADFRVSNINVEFDNKPHRYLFANSNAAKSIGSADKFKVEGVNAIGPKMTDMYYQNQGKQ